MAALTRSIIPVIAFNINLPLLAGVSTPLAEKIRLLIANRILVTSLSAPSKKLVAGSLKELVLHKHYVQLLPKSFSEKAIELVHLSRPKRSFEKDQIQHMFCRFVVNYWQYGFHEKRQGQLKTLVASLELENPKLCLLVHVKALTTLLEFSPSRFIVYPISKCFLESLKNQSIGYLKKLQIAFLSHEGKEGLFLQALIEAHIKLKDASFDLSESFKPLCEVILFLKGKSFLVNEPVKPFDLAQKQLLSHVASISILELVPDCLAPRSIQEALKYMELTAPMAFLGLFHLITNKYSGKITLEPGMLSKLDKRLVRKLYHAGYMGANAPFVTGLIRVLAFENNPILRTSHDLMDLLMMEGIHEEAFCDYFHASFLQNQSLETIKDVIFQALLHNKIEFYYHVSTSVLLTKGILFDIFAQSALEACVPVVRNLLTFHHSLLDDKVLLSALILRLSDTYHIEALALIKTHYPYFFTKKEEVLALTDHGLARYKNHVEAPYVFTYLSVLLKKQMIELYQEVFVRYMALVEDTDLMYLGVELIQNGYKEQFYDLYSGVQSWSLHELKSFFKELVFKFKAMEEEFLVHPTLATLSPEEAIDFLTQVFQIIPYQPMFYARFFMKLNFTEAQILAAFKFFAEAGRFQVLKCFKFSSKISQGHWDELILELFERKDDKALGCFVDPSGPKLSAQKKQVAKRFSEGTPGLEMLLSHIVIGSIYDKHGTHSEFSTFSGRIEPRCHLFDPRFALRAKQHLRIKALRDDD